MNEKNPIPELITDSDFDKIKGLISKVDLRNYLIYKRAKTLTLETGGKLRKPVLEELSKKFNLKKESIKKLYYEISKPEYYNDL